MGLFATDTTTGSAVAIPVSEIVFGSGASIASSPNLFFTAPTSNLKFAGSAPGITTPNLPFSLLTGLGILNLGTDAAAKSTNIGNNTGTSTVNLIGGTGGVQVSGTGDFASARPTKINSTLSVNTTFTGESVNISGGMKFVGGSLATWPTTSQSGIDTAAAGTLRLAGGTGGQLIHGSGNVVASWDTSNTFVLSQGRLQVGTNGIGNIPSRFSSSLSNNFSTVYGFLNSGGAGSNSAGTGSANYCAEFDFRVRFNQEINVFSDAREKFNIETLNPSACLAVVRSVRSVSFNRRNGDDQKELGFIAQEVGQAGFGDAVTVSEGVINGELVPDHHSLSQGAIIACLWAAVQELSADVKLLRESISRN